MLKWPPVLCHFQENVGTKMLLNNASSRTVISSMFRYPVIRAVKGLKGKNQFYLELIRDKQDITVHPCEGLCTACTV